MYDKDVRTHSHHTLPLLHATHVIIRHRCPARIEVCFNSQAKSERLVHAGTFVLADPPVDMLLM